MILPPLRSYGFAFAIAGFTVINAGATDFKSQVLPLLQKNGYCKDVKYK